MGDQEKLAAENYMLEINVISAQGLKVKAGEKAQTYAVACVNESHKLRTRVDRVGGENPTWNDRFVFRVDPHFLSSDTAAVNVAIYSIGFFRDHLIGTVRFLISNLYPSGHADSPAIAASYLRTPAATALQILRPSGRFHGVLNIGATVIDGVSARSLSGVSAMGYHDLMGGSSRRISRAKRLNKTMSSIGEEYAGNPEDDEGSESSSGCTPAQSPALRELNGENDHHGGIVVGRMGQWHVKSMSIGASLCGMRQGL